MALETLDVGLADADDSPPAKKSVMCDTAVLVFTATADILLSGTGLRLAGKMICNRTNKPTLFPKAHKSFCLILFLL